MGVSRALVRVHPADRRGRDQGRHPAARSLAAAHLSVLPEAARARRRVARVRSVWVVLPGAARARSSVRPEAGHDAQSPAALQAAPCASAAPPDAAAARTDVLVLRARGARHDPDGLAAYRDRAVSKYAAPPAVLAPSDRRNGPGRTDARDRQAALAAVQGASARDGAGLPAPCPYPETAGLAPAEQPARRRGRPSSCLPARSSSQAAGILIPRYVVS